MRNIILSLYQQLRNNRTHKSERLISTYRTFNPQKTKNVFVQVDTTHYVSIYVDIRYLDLTSTV